MSESAKEKSEHMLQQLREIQEMAVRLVAENKRLTEENERLRIALKEIAKGEGPFSMDHLTHASNTIDAMKELATEALNDRWP